jgi:hypothetical protein
MKEIDGFIHHGERRWFEYHCEESHDSADAELWYRSHQRVSVLDCVNAGDFGSLSFEERSESGHPLVYRVVFHSDNFIGTVFEDELLSSKDDFYRPDPPKGVEK